VLRDSRWPSFVSCAWPAFYPISRLGPANYASRWLSFPMAVVE